MVSREQRLLARRARLGDKQATHKIIASALPYLTRLAALIVHRSGLPLSYVEDLAQEGAIALLERIPHYRWRSSRARLENYAYRWIVSRMWRVACEHIELVRLPASSAIHGAHRDLEAGCRRAWIAQRWKLHPSTIDQLHRETVYSLEAVEEHSHDPPDETSALIAAHAWAHLPRRSALALSLRACCANLQARANMLGLSRSQTRMLEAQAMQRLESLRDLFGRMYG